MYTTNCTQFISSAAAKWWSSRDHNDSTHPVTNDCALWSGVRHHLTSAHLLWPSQTGANKDATGARWVHIRESPGPPIWSSAALTRHARRSPPTILPSSTDVVSSSLASPHPRRAPPNPTAQPGTAHTTVPHTALPRSPLTNTHNHSTRQHSTVRRGSLQEGACLPARLRAYDAATGLLLSEACGPSGPCRASVTSSRSTMSRCAAGSPACSFQ